MNYFMGKEMDQGLNKKNEQINQLKSKLSQRELKQKPHKFLQTICYAQTEMFVQREEREGLERRKQTNLVNGGVDSTKLGMSNCGGGGDCRDWIAANIGGGIGESEGVQERSWPCSVAPWRLSRCQGQRPIRSPPYAPFSRRGLPPPTHSLSHAHTHRNHPNRVMATSIAIFFLVFN